MLSKEEIEKAKERLKEILSCYDEYKKDYEEGHQSSFGIDLKDFKTLETLLQYMDQLEFNEYEANERLKEYIEERHNLIDIMKADRMEQFDDYVIYLIEKYLKELGAFEDE